MRMLARRFALVTLTLAGIMVPALVGLARAEIVMKDLGGGLVRCEVRCRCNGNPINTPWSLLSRPLVGPGIAQYRNACMEAWPPCAVVWLAQYNFAVPAEIAPVIWSFGGATAGGGGLNTETLPDSLIAGVGLYIPGGGTNLQNPPPDSVLNLRVNKQVSNQLTMTINTGGMQVRGLGNTTGIVNYTVGVYPDTTTANADVSFNGTGAISFGKVVLQAGLGVTPGYTATGMFSSGDWILQPQPGGKYTLRPNGTITKVIPLPGGVTAATAAIYVTGDPQTIVAGTPGYSPFGLVLLALGLLGSGFWVIRSRQRVETA